MLFKILQFSSDNCSSVTICFDFYGLTSQLLLSRNVCCCYRSSENTWYFYKLRKFVPCFWRTSYFTTNLMKWELSYLEQKEKVGSNSAVAALREIRKLKDNWRG